MYILVFNFDFLFISDTCACIGRNVYTYYMCRGVLWRCSGEGMVARMSIEWDTRERYAYLCRKLPVYIICNEMYADVHIVGDVCVSLCV